MTTVSFTAFRQSLAKYLNKAEQDSEEIVISRSKGRKSVVLDYDDYVSLKETAYLLSSPANRKHLAKSITQIDKGETVEVVL